jgi:hypothetical protein
MYLQYFDVHHIQNYALYSFTIWSVMDIVINLLDLHPGKFGAPFTTFLLRLLHFLGLWYGLICLFF